MDDLTFEEEVNTLIDIQDGTEYIRIALDELQSEYVDDVPRSAWEFFLARCVALWEEDQWLR